MPTVAQPTRKERRDAARRARIEREAALAAAAARRRPALRPGPRGGLLIAVSLARRGPPAGAIAR